MTLPSVLLPRAVAVVLLPPCPRPWHVVQTTWNACVPCYALDLEQDIARLEAEASGYVLHSATGQLYCGVAHATVDHKHR